MFTWLYDTVFPSIGLFVTVLAEFSSLPTAYLGVLLQGDAIGFNLTNYFTGEDIVFNFISYGEIFEQLFSGSNIGDFISEGLTAVISVFGTFIYNLCWSPFTNMPMFIGLPLGGFVFILATFGVRLFIKTCGLAFSRA